MSASSGMSFFDGVRRSRTDLEAMRKPLALLFRELARLQHDRRMRLVYCALFCNICMRTLFRRCIFRWDDFAKHCIRVPRGVIEVRILN